MTTFEFVEELPKLVSGGRPQQLLIDFADALRAAPEQWAKYPKPLSLHGGRNAAWHINHQGVGACAALRTGEFQAKTRDGVLYVRYIGESA